MKATRLKEKNRLRGEVANFIRSIRDATADAETAGFAERWTDYEGYLAWLAAEAKEEIERCHGRHAY